MPKNDFDASGQSTIVLETPSICRSKLSSIKYYRHLRVVLVSDDRDAMVANQNFSIDGQISTVGLSNFKLDLANVDDRHPEAFGAVRSVQHGRDCQDDCKCHQTDNSDTEVSLHR